MAIFGRKACVNPFGTMSIFRFFELLVFIAQKGGFSFQNIIKDIFLAYISIKKSWKMDIFGHKPWVNPFGKMSIFRRFELFVFIAKKTDFCSRISSKTFSWPILAKKKKLKKWTFLDQNHGLTPYEKCKFFDFLNFLILQARKAFYWSRI